MTRSSITAFILLVIFNFCFRISYAQEEPCSDLEAKSSQGLRELPVCLYASSVNIQSIQESSLAFSRLLALDSSSSKATKSNSTSDYVALELSHNLALKEVELEQLRKIVGDVLVYDNTNLEVSHLI